MMEGQSGEMAARTERFQDRASASSSAFTLVELLLVIGIIALLLGILLPALNLARAHSRAAKCMANLRTIGQAMVEYANDNHQFIVPSYNLPNNYQVTPATPLDGWACIFDRDGYVTVSEQQSENTPFYCPDTFDEAGMGLGQTGLTVNGNQGWMDWPFATTGDDSAPKTAVTMPAEGFNKIIRVSYWINAANPLSTTAPTSNSYLAKDFYYTTSVGYGIAAYGFLHNHKMTDVVRSSDVVALADGVFAGRQSSSRQVYAQIANPLTGFTNRIAYRHPGINGSNSATNVCFADGHVERFGYANFPVPVSASFTHDQNQALVNGPTIYATTAGVVMPN